MKDFKGNVTKVTILPSTSPLFLIFDTFFLILKKLQNDFESKVDFYLERSQSEIPLRFFGIRSFDLSKSITKEDYSETKIFGCLWFILNKEYEKVEGITLEKHLEIREILELLFFIKSKINEEGKGDKENENIDANKDHLNNDHFNFCLDQDSSLLRIYSLILDYLRINFKSLLFPSFTPYFFRFIEENVLTDLFHLSFLFMDLEDFKKGFTKIKNKEKVIEEYFKILKMSKVREGGVEEKGKVDNKVDTSIDNVHLNSSLIYDLEDFTLKGISEVGESLNYGNQEKEGDHYGDKEVRDVKSIPTPYLNPYLSFIPTNTLDHIYAFSLILKSKFLKSNLVFRNLKSFIEMDLENLYDTVGVHFVSHLNSNECIILDSKLKTKCKFKTLLGKKCKDPEIGSTTYI
ncbi:hypothetical protein NBO_445g0001 [Nosema bombycis CQ1]|uniref:Uncharacterized protein n=1 Tax=Nosema bombycis (strain CQ1 / CVCC 102059) TaxID=578461 RepID=R0KP10_NOSB1|nr:hypothetical protein NBO_445g0001 [Nosema bombycis CQ1]|eukprot:EOB12416.1 hypothetical protein NBO_445g0001 [Nosema bombycis CQ1]